MTMQLLVLCLLSSALAVPVAQDQARPVAPTCGYASCNQHEKDVLNVHIVAHTHDDVGWLKTVDQYFYGTRNNIQHAGVKYILDSVVKELWEDPKRRFVYVESFFFFKWWNYQSDAVKQKVHTLVSEGRLQFAGGAWSMNDEAAAHYHSTVDQFTFGLRALNDTFGECGMPTVGWQIDPFGHSREFANLLAGMGYDGVFFGRIDYQDKENRMNKTSMEMLWRGDDDLGKPSDIFAGVLYNMYQPPPGFCFDVFCSDQPIVEDPRSPEYNVDGRVSEFLEVCVNMSKAYANKNILMTMGEDFHYQDARMWFTNLDKLIKYTNMKAAKAGIKVKLFYSTPQCYLKAIYDSEPTLPTKQDDFFPYASAPREYWTGYYTSRPTTKYFERETNGYLQMAKQLQVLAGLEEHNMFVLDELKSAMGIMQHHDAITGTEKQHVAHDYERILNDAIEDSLIIPRQALNKFMQGNATKLPIFSYGRCRLNESSCDVSETNTQFVVTVYNHLAWQVNEPVRIPVVDGSYEVYAPNGDKISSQIVDIPQAVLQIPTRNSKATHEIVFIAYLHPLSYKSFYIRNIQTEDLKANEVQPSLEENGEKSVTDISTGYTNENTYKIVDGGIDDLKQVDLILKEAQNLATMFELESKGGSTENPAASTAQGEDTTMMSDGPRIVERFPSDWVLENQHLKIRADPLSQKLVVRLSDNTDVTVGVKYCYYNANFSGAYIFRPDNTTPQVIPTKLVKGPSGDVVKELRVISEGNVSSTIRIYDGLNFIENDWVVGPIYISNAKGKEFVVRYVTDILNNGEFYTDSNGRQMLKRKLFYRPQWNLTLAEPVSGNYYPVVNKISIQDDNVKVSVVTDRAEGGTSLEEGQLEVMVHRRLVKDDGKGVGEALNETVLDGVGLVVRGRQRLFLSKLADKEDSVKEKKNVIQFDIQPQAFVSAAQSLSLQDWLKLKNCYSWANALPDGLHLLTLEPWKDNTILLRLENYLELSDRADSTIEVDLKSIFKTLKLKSYKETTLAANRWLKDVKPWTWRTRNDFEEYPNVSRVDSEQTESTINGDKFNIQIAAKQIRTFVVEYELS